MNRNALIGLGVLVLVLVYFTSSGTLSLIADLGVEESTAKEYIKQYDEKVIDFLERTEFRKPTEKDVEIYEMKLKDGETKLKVQIDWENEYIRLLDESSAQEADMTVYVAEGTYRTGIQKVREAIEENHTVIQWNDIIFYLEVSAWGTRVEGQDKTLLIRWMTSSAPKAKAEYEDMKE